MSKIIICDIDGTIADLSHRLHFIEGSKKDYDGFFLNCVNDTPHDDILRLLEVVADLSTIKYFSGRSDMVRSQTEQWLLLNGAPTGELRMRKHSDHRPDFEVKAEMIGDIKPEDVWFILDDRDQVVQMWRSKGFRVLQVADGKF